MARAKLTKKLICLNELGLDSQSLADLQAEALRPSQFIQFIKEGIKASPQLQYVVLTGNVSLASYPLAYYVFEPTGVRMLDR